MFPVDWKSYAFSPVTHSDCIRAIDAPPSDESPRQAKMDAVSPRTEQVKPASDAETVST